MSRRKLAIGFILVLSLFLNAMAMATNDVYVVDRSEDDAFRTETGNLISTSSFVAVKDPGYSLFSYFEFRNITVDVGQPIDNATLSVYTVANQAADLTALATIYGLEVDDGGLSDYRTVSSSSIVWNVSQARGVGQWHNVTVTAIVQELIDRFNWDRGDNIAFEILATPGALRQFVAFDYGNPTLVARLYVTYGIAPPVPPGLPPGTEYVETYEGHDIFRVPGFGQVTFLQTGQDWDSSSEVYPFQEKTAYSNVTDRFYILLADGDSLFYFTKTRTSDAWDADDNFTLWDSIAGGNVYCDYHLWRDGVTLDVAWIDTWLNPNEVFYQRWTLQVDGTATNVTPPIQIYQNAIDAQPPITINLDSEGYPYVAFATTAAGPSYSGQVAWSNLNNGTFNHTTNSPVSVEVASGANPPNVNGPYVCELYRGGDRRMFLIYLVPDAPGDVNEVRSARIKDCADDWIPEGDPTADASNNRLRRFSVSGSSICDDGDSFNSSLLTPDASDHELYERPVNIPVRVDDSFGTTDIMVMGATMDGYYYTISGEDGQISSLLKVRDGAWTGPTTARTFTDAVDTIKMWEFCGQQYPVLNNSRTIVSYAWHQATAPAGFWHDWFYLDVGPNSTVTDPYYISFNNDTHECSTIECLKDLIDGDDPDPEDPEPGPWAGSPTAFSRFRMRLYFLVIGWGCLWGPIWFFCYRRPSGFYICVAFIIMVMGLGLLIQMPYV